MEVKRYIKDLRIAAGQKHKPEWISGAQQLEEFVDKLMQTGELPERRPKIVQENKGITYAISEKQLHQLNIAGSKLPDDTLVIEVIICDTFHRRDNSFLLDWKEAIQQLNYHQKSIFDRIMQPLRHPESGRETTLGDIRRKSEEQLKTIPGVGDRAVHVIKTIFEKQPESP